MSGRLEVLRTSMTLQVATPTASQSRALPLTRAIVSFTRSHERGKCRSAHTPSPALAVALEARAHTVPASSQVLATTSAASQREHTRASELEGDGPGRAATSCYAACHRCLNSLAGTRGNAQVLVKSGDVPTGL
jgi:hypothetical protein